jgi:hypothetical protein
LIKPLLKFKRHMIPTMKTMRIRSAETETIAPKKPQVTKVHRNVGESNMAPHPTRYRPDRTRNRIMGGFHSNLVANQP